MPARTLGHLSRYAGSSLLLTVASVISFPILTRVFTVEQYGLLSYVGLILSLLVGLAKLGMQHAAVRFRSEVERAESPYGVDGYVATIVFGMAISGVIIALLWALASQWVPDAVWNDPLMKPLLLLTSALVAMRTIESAYINLLKAAEQSAALAVFMVARRYVELVAILLTLFFISRSLWGFFIATMLVEMAGLIVLAVWYSRHQSVSVSQFSPPLWRDMLVYAVPMVGFELASVVLSLGDRYVIQSLLGATSLGVYAAAYNLSDYIKIVLITSVASAVMPVYLRVHASEGEQATREFLARVLYFYLMVAAAVVCGLAVVGEAVVALVASAKYQEGAVIIPWVVAGMAFEGLLPVLGAALYIQKRSQVILVIVAAAAVVNIVANFVLVPRYGILGAAWATTGSYALMLALAAWQGRGVMHLPLPWLAMLRFSAAAITMALAIAQISLASAGLQLMVQIVLGVLVYAALMLGFDRSARNMVPLIIGRLKASRT